MKQLLIGILISFLLISTACASSGSDYDKRWEIIVTDCQGNTTIYESCAITNQGEDVVTFVPNTGKGSNPHGPTIKVFLSDCQAVMMSEEQ